MICYCTYFDKNYLARGLLLISSLAEHSKRPFHMLVLCLDEPTYDALLKLDLPNVRLIRMSDFEKDDAQLREAKGNRSLVEYYWTCTSSLLLYIMTRNPRYDWYVYLDADQYFFNDPVLAFSNTDNASILLVEHSFSPELEHLKENGRFNVGFVGFRCDDEGLASSTWWRERCIEWCHDRNEDGKFGDQKYLDNWPEMFSHVKVLNHPGIGLAQWNIEQYTLTCDDKNCIRINDAPLILYHFHGIKREFRWFYSMEMINVSGIVRHKIYGFYLKRLLGLRGETRRILNESIHPVASIRHRKYNNSSYMSLRERLRSVYGFVRRLLRREFIFTIGRYVC